MPIRHKKFVANLLLLLFVIFVFIFAIEVGARIISTQSYNYKCSFYADSDYVEICRFSYNSKMALEKYNQTTLRADQDICDIYDSELDWIPRPNCTTWQYNTNSDGIRGTEEYSLIKNETRIVFIGDSFTWGEDVSDNNTFSSQLDQISGNEFEVINLGVHGYGPAQFLIHYNRTGIKYDPDVLVFALYIPDIHRATKNFKDYFKPRFIYSEGDLILKNIPIPTVEEAYDISLDIRNKKRLYSLAMLQRMFMNIYDKSANYNEEVFITEQIIKQTQELAGDETDFVVLLIPTEEMVLEENKDYYGVLPDLIYFFEEENIQYIDLLPTLRSHYLQKNSNLFNGHFTVEGNKVAAQGIYSSLKDMDNSGSIPLNYFNVSSYYLEKDY